MKISFLQGHCAALLSQFRALTALSTHGRQDEHNLCDSSITEIMCGPNNDTRMHTVDLKTGCTWRHSHTGDSAVFTKLYIYPTSVFSKPYIRVYFIFSHWVLEDKSFKRWRTSHDRLLHQDLPRLCLHI